MTIPSDRLLMVNEARMRISITTKATRRLENVPQPPPLRSAWRSANGADEELGRFGRRNSAIVLVEMMTKLTWRGGQLPKLRGSQKRNEVTHLVLEPGNGSPRHGHLLRMPGLGEIRWNHLGGFPRLQQFR